MIPASLPDLKVEVTGNTCCSNNRSKNVVYDPRKNNFKVQSTSLFCCIFGPNKETDEATADVFCRCLTSKYAYKETESIRKEVLEKGLTKDRFHNIVRIAASRAHSQNTSLADADLSSRIAPSQGHLPSVMERHSSELDGNLRKSDRLKRRHLTPLDIELSVKIHLAQNEESGNLVDREETLTPAFVVSALRRTPVGSKFHSNAINKVVRLVINELQRSGSKDVYEEAEIINLVERKGGEVLDELGDRSDCSTQFDEMEIRSDSPFVPQQGSDDDQEQTAELFNLTAQVRGDQQSSTNPVRTDPSAKNKHSSARNKLSLSLGGSNRGLREYDLKEEDTQNRAKTFSPPPNDYSPGGYSGRRLNSDGSSSRGGSPNPVRKKSGVKEWVPSSRLHMSKGPNRVQNQSGASQTIIGAPAALCLPADVPPFVGPLSSTEPVLGNSDLVKVSENSSELSQNVPIRMEQGTVSQPVGSPLPLPSDLLANVNEPLKSLPTVTFF